MADRADAHALRERLIAWGEARGWSGTDPYEGLNARRVPGPLKRHPVTQRVVIQAVKRSPVDLRPVLGIPPGRSAAALAWIASAYARDPERDAAPVLAGLDALRLDAFPEPSWGYHFDFRSRVFFYDRRTPNTIATAFAGHALADAGRVDDALGVARFFLRRIPQTADAPGAFFGYLPADRSPIHNSSMLVAGLLARLASAAPDGDAFAAAAERAAEWTIARQRDDGSWPYGERPNLAWVDGFHTGYVLDALRLCADAGIGAGAEAAWERGLEHYRTHLIEPSGRPRYTTASAYPLDAQCVAQALQTLSLAGCADDAFRVLGWALEHGLRRDGMPWFQQRRRWTNRALHVRWVVAPYVLALTHLLEAADRAARPSLSVAR